MGIVILNEKPERISVPGVDGYLAGKGFWQNVRSLASRGQAVMIPSVLRFDVSALRRFLQGALTDSLQITVFTQNIVFWREYERIFFPERFKEAQRYMLIVDLHNLFHRIYHGVPYEEVAGVPARLVVKTCNILYSVFKEFGFKNTVLVTDSSGSSYRRMFAKKSGISYKSRDRDGQLEMEIAIAESYFRAIGVPVLESEGFEADDIVGSLVDACCRNGITPAILSSDKDFLQIADRCDPDFVLIKDPWKSNQPFVPLRRALQERIPGVPPGRVLDYMSLVGDQADGIPGAKGIGQAGALKILSRTASFDEILRDEEVVKKASKTEAPRGYIKTVEASRKLISLEYGLITDHQIKSLAQNSLIHPQASLLDAFRFFALYGFWKNS